jgi:hypothetical protein
MLSALALGLGGCAQEVGDIDRTQPNKLRKTIFNSQDEWYVRQTVVGVPGAAQVSFEGFEGDVSRVRFDIREDVLVARRTHEDVLGIDTSLEPPLDPNVKPGLKFSTPDDFMGAPVAAFPIINHFDVQRAYNPSTGEQQNVLVENSSDRVWNDREYMRVNWGTNMLLSADMPINFEYSPDISNRPEFSWYEDRGNSTTPIYIECLDKQTGEFYDCDPDNLGDDEEVGYMELTNTYVIEPDWLSCIFAFGFPLYGGFCGAETITVRTSFVKVDEEELNTYEPRVYSDNEMKWFGFFRTERCTYDRLYGCRDQSTLYLANRHKIWQTFFNDTNGNGTYDYGVDEYLPYSARTPRPIVYYLTDNVPVDLLDENLRIADSYNETFGNIVRQVNDPNYSGRMFYLCANSGSEEEYTRYATAAAELTQYGGGEFVNSANHGDFEGLWAQLLKGYDDGVCKRRNKHKILGDMRYSYFAWIDHPQQNGPLGYGPSSADPLTGWVFNADAHIYGGDLDWYAQYNVDLIDLVNGDLDPLAFGFGENVTGYLEDAYDRFGIPHNGWGHVSEVDTASITQKDLDKLSKHAEKIEAASERLNDPRFREKLRIEPHQLARKDDRYRNTWERMKGTPLDAKLLLPEIKTGLGAGVVAPDADVTEDVVDALSLRKTGIATPNGKRSVQFDKSSEDYWDRFDRFASRNIYMGDFMDDNYLGLAIMLRDKYQGESNDLTRRLKLWYWMRGYIYEEVTTHEVGHTVGLRHNFEGSYDSMSFDPKYWEIRNDTNRQLAIEDGNAACSTNSDCTEELIPGVKKVCSSGVCRTPCPSTDGVFITDAHCPSRGILPRDFQNRITEYAYTSIMDYGYGGTSQTHGLGLWDKAALHYGYVDLVHVFKQGAEPKKFEMVVDADGDMIAGRIGTSSETVTDFDDIEVVAKLDEGQEETGTASGDLLDKNLNYWHYSVLNLMFDNKGNGGMSKMYEREYIPLSEYNVENPTRLRVPYRFCSDEFNGATPYCRVFDSGADFQELMNTLTNSYESYYFLNSYRRGRAGWGLWLWPYLQRLQSRYFSPMAALYQQWLIRASEWDDLDYFWQINPYAGRLSQVASEDGLRTLLNVLNTPHPGTYIKCTATSTDPDCLDYSLTEGTADTYINISNDENYRLNEAGTQDWLRLAPGEKAKWRFSRYDYDSGYYYFLRYQILSSFWDRWAAFIALTNPEYNDIGVDSSSDITGYMVPYYLVYDYELSKVFGGMMTQDWTNFAPVVNVRSLEAGKSWREAMEYRDPLATPSQQAAYQNPARYTTLNPYPASYGNSSYNDRFFAAVYGIAFFQVMYDMSFNHASNISIINDAGFGSLFADSDGDGAYDIQEGEGDSNGDGLPDFLDPATQPEMLNLMPTFELYKDPFNHKVYAAVNYTNTRNPLYSPGIKIIRRANQLKKAWQEGRIQSWELQNAREDMENMMLCNKVFSDFNSPGWIVEDM